MLFLLRILWYNSFTDRSEVNKFMPANYTRGLYRDYELLLTENEKIKAEMEILKMTAVLFEKERERREKLEIDLEEKNQEIEALKKEVLRLNGILNLDGTNSGIPTSKTPLSKKKVIPNSRKKSGKKIGGQPSHAKHQMAPFEEDEVTEIEEHEAEVCPRCGGKIVKTGEAVQKDELDYKVVVRKIRHRFPRYQCEDCGYQFHAAIPKGLKEKNQYGNHVKALGLSLMNIGNVSVGKVRKMIYGLSEEGIHPTEGYLMKQEKKAAEALQPFIEELRKKCLKLQLIYWDDTVIAINGNRGCLRFYGNERYALYFAHRYKDKEGLDEDRILSLLPKETVVMHDHNRVNYNQEYSFSNIECNVHLLRDLQKVSDNMQHEWAAELKQLLEKTNKERNEAMERGENEFSAAYVKTFFESYDQIMLKASKENLEDCNKYYGDSERALILRLFEYKDNYLAWVVNFDLPFSNNLSERALRGIKSKMKIAGQFQNESTAKDYAVVKSYIETCYRHGVNETKALLRLCEGTPYTIAEMEKEVSDA